MGGFAGSLDKNGGFEVLCTLKTVVAVHLEILKVGSEGFEQGLVLGARVACRQYDRVVIPCTQLPSVQVRQLELYALVGGVDIPGFMAGEQVVARAACHLLGVENPEDFLDLVDVRSGIIGVPEFVQKVGTFLGGAAVHVVGERHVEDFIDGGAVVRGVHGAPPHDQVHIGRTGVVVQIQKNLDRTLPRANDSDALGIAEFGDAAQIAA